MNKRHDILGADGHAGARREFLGPHDERVGLLRALNEVIEDYDRDFRIGPSYLMRPGAADPAGLELVWKYDLLPVPEEHYYGRMNRSDVHDRFGLQCFRRRTASRRG